MAFHKPGTGNGHCQLLIYGERGHHHALDLDPDCLRSVSYFLHLAQSHLKEAARRLMEVLKKMTQELACKAAEKRREE